MRRSFFKVIAFLGAFMTASPAVWAATLTVPFSAACLNDCSAAGMATDAIVGLVRGGHGHVLSIGTG